MTIEDIENLRPELGASTYLLRKKITRENSQSLSAFKVNLLNELNHKSEKITSELET